MFKQNRFQRALWRKVHIFTKSELFRCMLVLTSEANLILGKLNVGVAIFLFFFFFLFDSIHPLAPVLLPLHEHLRQIIKPSSTVYTKEVLESHTPSC